MNFESFFKESILDYARPGLDPQVFTTTGNGPPVLNSGIKVQIEKDVTEIKRYLPTKRILIIGSILTKNYTKSSDIDVTVEVHKEDLDLDYGGLGAEKIIQMLKQLNGKLATGTTHPINYFITTDFDDDNADAIYDFETDKWIKEPIPRELNIDNYIKTFNDLVSSVDLITGKLRRDAIDYNELKEMDDYSIVNLHSIMSKKLYEINKNIETLVSFKKEIKDKRKAAFSRPMEPEEIIKYASKNRLPENVIYKLFQKYYYFDLINRLDEIIKNRDKSNEYVNDIEDILGYKESFSFEDYLIQEKIRKKFNLSVVKWGDPKSIRKYQDRRFAMSKGEGVSNLRQVPESQKKRKTLNLAHKVVEVAKRSPSGIWRVTPAQVQEIAIKYHHIAPDKRNPVKHLGNTGIAVWRKSKNKYFLVKQRRLRRK